MRIADLADKSALTAACTGMDRVFHCAGYAHAFSSLSGDDSALHWQINFEGTRNLVEAAGAAGSSALSFCPASRPWPSRAALLPTRTWAGSRQQLTARPSGQRRRRCLRRGSDTACMSSICVWPWFMAPGAR
ncbi:MAG: NAD-dependent epimerase/dehydratase family protein [Dechloromonas sp.]|nr:MAG: NAD-dependent epimerase/dehydratase family protein [Dechloromonas sp.]